MPIHVNVRCPRYYGEITSAPADLVGAGAGYADTSLMQLFKFSNNIWSAIYNLTPIAAPGGLYGIPMGLLLTLTYPTDTG